MLRRGALLVLGSTVAVLLLGPAANAAGTGQSPVRAGGERVGAAVAGPDGALSSDDATGADAGVPPAPDDDGLLDVDPTDPGIGKRMAPAAAPAALGAGQT